MVTITKDKDLYVVSVDVDSAIAKETKEILLQAHLQIVQQMTVESDAANADERIADLEESKGKVIPVPK